MSGVFAGGIAGNQMKMVLSKIWSRRKLKLQATLAYFKYYELGKVFVCGRKSSFIYVRPNVSVLHSVFVQKGMLFSASFCYPRNVIRIDWRKVIMRILQRTDIFICSVWGIFLFHVLCRGFMVCLFWIHDRDTPAGDYPPPGKNLKTGTNPYFWPCPTRR